MPVNKRQFSHSKLKKKLFWKQLVDKIFRGAWKAILELCRRFVTCNSKLRLEGQYSPGSCDLNSKNAHGDKCSKCSNTTEKPEILFGEPVEYDIAEIFCEGGTSLPLCKKLFCQKSCRIGGYLTPSCLRNIRNNDTRKKLKIAF